MPMRHFRKILVTLKCLVSLCFFPIQTKKPNHWVRNHLRNQTAILPGTFKSTQKDLKSNSGPIRQPAIQTAAPSNQFQTNITLPGRTIKRSYEEDNRLENVRQSVQLY